MNKIFKFITILFVVCCCAAPASAKLNMFPKARYIPELNFYDDNGKAYKLKDFKSELLMVVLWSRTCGPCIKDMANLDKFAQKVKDKGIRVILISPESEWKSVEERHIFMDRLLASHLESYVDKKANFMKGMGIFITPTVILVNKKTQEAGQITGSAKWDDPDMMQYMLKLKAKISKELDKGESAN